MFKLVLTYYNITDQILICTPFQCHLSLKQHILIWKRKTTFYALCGSMFSIKGKTLLFYAHTLFASIIIIRYML